MSRVVTDIQSKSQTIDLDDWAPPITGEEALPSQQVFLPITLDELTLLNDDGRIVELISIGFDQTEDKHGTQISQLQQNLLKRMG